MQVRTPSPDLKSRIVDPAERRERFRRLRTLVRDEDYRHRLLVSTDLLALAVVGLLAAFVRLNPVLPVDLWATREFQEHPITRLMYDVSLFGYLPWSLITVAIGVIIVAILLGWRDGAYLLGVTIAQGLVNVGVKLLIGRPRPVSSLVEVFVPEQGNSFPSGHVMFYTVFFGFLVFLAWTRLPRSIIRWLVGGAGVVLIALIGPARIALGSHWLSDVLAAYMLGLVLLSFAIEGYFIWLAPSTTEQEQGLMRAIDKADEAEGG